MKHFLLAPILKNLAWIGLGLVFFGMVGKVIVWMTVGLWVVWRFQQLWAEGRRPKMTEEDWQREEQEVPRRVDALRSQEPQCQEGPGAEWEAQRKELIDHWLSGIARVRAAYAPPRSMALRIAEGIGCLGFLILLPLTMELAKNDLVSLRRSYGFETAAFFAFCAGLHALPKLRRFRSWPGAVFWAWWVVPTLVMVPVTLHLLQSKHPYLDPTNPQRVRLAAEKVLTHPDFIVASDHADWVVTYARDVAQHGETERAVDLCREALRMNPQLWSGSVLLTALLGGQSVEESTPLVSAPYVEEGATIPTVARCRIENAVGESPRCTVLLLPMGVVDPALLDHVAFVLQHETGLQTKVYERTLPLPAPTRTRGLLGRTQWEVTPLVEAMSAEISGRQVGGRVQILVVTNADIYMGDANFVFAANADWGSVVSIARMSENGDSELLKHRAAKLCYGSLIKSLGVPAAADWRCVTSYSASLNEFDAKGNRPVPATKLLLEKAVDRVEREWLEQARRSG